MPPVPDIHPMLTTRSAEIGLASPGIVWVRIKPDAEQTLEDASDNLEACAKVAAGECCPLLLDLRTAKPLEAEVRHFYSGPRLEAFAALALVVTTRPLGVMMGNVYLKVVRPKVPAQLFHELEPAMEWLQSQSRRRA